MLKNTVRRFFFFTAGVAIIAPSNAIAQSVWAGLPDLPDVADVANWMTPQKARYFSQWVHDNCARQDTLNRYYYGSLPVCNAYQAYYDEENGRLEAENQRLDRILECQRSGNRYCF